MHDAWGKCTITKDINGIGILNPFRWKSQYCDEESGLYLIPTTSGSRYYSPVMKSFISACNINEILYNINIPGNLNAYAIGNPMYFPVNSYNIFTSIPLVPENLGSDNNWNLPEWVKWTVGSIVIAGLWISVPFTGGSTLPMAIGATALGAGGLITAGFTSGWDIGSMASGYMAGSLLGAACGAAYMLAPSAAFAGVGNKFTADITAFAFFGKPIPLFDNFQWEGYAIAYTFGGMTKGIGSGLKFGLDVGLRPAVNQWVLMGTRGKDWSTEQYIVDVLIRGTTFGIENSFAKSMLRGYGSGLYWRIRQLFG